MNKEYDFSKGKRGAVIASTGKTRITIMLDEDILEAFRKKAEESGRGYQTMINETLRLALDPKSAPVTLRELKTILDERLPT